MKSLTSRKFLLTVLFMVVFTLNGALGWGISEGQFIVLAGALGIYVTGNVVQKGREAADALLDESDEEVK